MTMTGLGDLPQEGDSIILEEGCEVSFFQGKAILFIFSLIMKSHVKWK